METAETHSMSMEFFAWPYLDAFFPKAGDAERYRFQHALDALSFLPYGTMVDEFQHRVYADPDLTPAERNAVWLELEAKYRPYIDQSGIPYLERGTRWQYQMHIYETPFYYIDYCLAQTAAFQFLLASQDDYDDAFARYLHLSQQGGEKLWTDLLAEAGYPDGFSTTLWCSDTQVMRDSAVVIQEQLRQVGINAEVKTLESGQFQSETGNGAHDMFIMSKTSIDPDSMLRSMYHTEALGPSGNRCFWTTPEVDALIDEASTTTDTEHAMELYAEIQSKVAEAAPLVPMAVEHLNAGMQSNVKGFGLYPGKSHYINGTYFE